MRFRPLTAILATALAPLMLSCSGDEPAADARATEILLAATADGPAASRAADSDLPSDYALWVAAINDRNDGSDPIYYFGSAIELPFAWDSSQSVWKCTDFDCCYPFDGTIDFLAYGMVGAAHHPTPSYSPAVPSLPSAATFDTLTLDFGTLLDGTDPVVFSDIKGVPCASHAGIEQLHFRHALSKVAFSVRAANTATASRLHIYSLTLRDIRTSGSLAITPLPTTTIGTETFGSTAAWQMPLKGDSRAFTLANASTVTPPLVSGSDPSTFMGDPLYLPTQGAGTTDLLLDISYSFHNNGFDELDAKTVTITIPATQWLPGRQYVYMLTFNLAEITVSTLSGALIDDWDENPVVSDVVYP